MNLYPVTDNLYNRIKAGTMETDIDIGEEEVSEMRIENAIAMAISESGIKLAKKLGMIEKKVVGHNTILELN